MHTLQITIFNLCTCTSDIESGDYELRMQKEQRNIELDTTTTHCCRVITFGVRERMDTVCVLARVCVRVCERECVCVCMRMSLHRFTKFVQR